MEPGKENSNKSLHENQPENEDLMFDSDDDSDFEVNLLHNLEDVEEEPLFSHIQEPYKVMSEAEIKQCQEHDITNISEILLITRTEASLLLLHCNWNINAVPEVWFSNGQNVREELGLSNFPMVGLESSDGKDLTCGICSGVFSKELTAAALCGHIFCRTCWAGYIGTSIKDGIACLMLRCPEPSCNAAVGQDMINMLASDDDKNTYAGYFLSSYIDRNPKAKWCPISECNHAVILVSDKSGSKVTCNCSTSFCMKCTEEPHQPVTCATRRKWELESYEQTKNWFIANTKDCPKCGLSVEVKGRSKLLECVSCKYQFCKLCLASLVGQSVWEGDDNKHVCSQEKLNEPFMKEEEERVKVAQQIVNRYHSSHFQWVNHDMHVQLDLEELQKLQDGPLQAIAEKLGLTEADMSFVKEAWLQIVDCKQFFKWATTYDFYLPDGQNGKRVIFNYLLRRALIILEHLYQYTPELKTFLDTDRPLEEFIRFREELICLTWVNKNYFDNMVFAIENRIKTMTTLRCAMETRMYGVVIRADVNNEQREAVNRQPWNCTRCQFNNDASVLNCVMCYYS